MKRTTALLLCLCLLVCAVFTVSAAPLPAESGLSDFEWDVLLRTNRERLAEGLEPLTTTSLLQKACDIRSNELRVSFSHTRPDGTPCSSVFQEAGCGSYSTCGENIAAGYPNPAAVVSGWMNSPGHRANILDADFRHMGTGYAEFSDSYRSYWVQLFYTGFHCKYTSIKLASSNIVAPDCTSIDDARLTLALECGCGTTYLPLMEEFCTGFTPGKTGKQTITVTCCGLLEKLDIVVSQFSDVPGSAWYADAVNYAVSHNLFNGTGDTTFEPDSPMTRAMLVTVLHRYEGTPKEGTNPFTDVPAGLWYTDAVAWASSTGVVNGVGDGRFDPDGVVTREQLATILYRYCAAKGYDTSGQADLSAFPDKDQVSGFAQTALKWAVAAELINGTEEDSVTYLNPRGEATRAQVAAILMRFCEKIAN